jgi:hypothetical protein
MFPGRNASRTPSQDLDLLREDVHRAVLGEDPNAPQLLQMLLQLPTFRGARNGAMVTGL